jgi:hypothetical protein
MRQTNAPNGIEAGLQLAALVWLPWHVWAAFVMPPAPPRAEPLSSKLPAEEAEFEFVP